MPLKSFIDETPQVIYGLVDQTVIKWKPCSSK